MAKGIKELRSRVRSIKNTKKITRAMEMVSAAKLRRTQGVMDAALPFQRKLQLLIGRLALSPVAAAHPLFEAREVTAERPPLLVLFTADRGLCGAFNSNLIKAAQRYLAENPTALVYFVGRKGRDFFSKRLPAERVLGSRADFGGKIEGPVAEAIGNLLVEQFSTGRVARIDFVSAEFVSTAYNRPQTSRYLPLEATAFGLSEEEASHPIDYLLEPTPQQVFDAILPRYLKNKIYLTLAETMTCEHSSRMLAMNAATKNCDELSSKLTLEMNKARQAGITTEILEIVSGAEALKG